MREMACSPCPLPRLVPRCRRRIPARAGPAPPSRRASPPRPAPHRRRWLGKTRRYHLPSVPKSCYACPSAQPPSHQCMSAHCIASPWPWPTSPLARRAPWRRRGPSASSPCHGAESAVGPPRGCLPSPSTPFPSTRPSASNTQSAIARTPSTCSGPAGPGLAARHVRAPSCQSYFVIETKGGKAPADDAGHAATRPWLPSFCLPSTALAKSKQLPALPFISSQSQPLPCQSPRRPRAPSSCWQRR